MVFLKRMLFAIVALIVFVVALLAAADNSNEVALKFLEYETPVWPISWWVLLAFVLGTLFGNLLNIVANTRLRMNVRAANKVTANTTKALDIAKASNLPAEVSDSPAGQQ